MRKWMAYHTGINAVAPKASAKSALFSPNTPLSNARLIHSASTWSARVTAHRECYASAAADLPDNANPEDS
jgi:hypothetical protein